MNGPTWLPPLSWDLLSARRPRAPVSGWAAGAATGLLLWRLHPSVGPGGVVAWALAGMAVGGLGDWVADAVQGGSEQSGIPLGFSVRW